MHFPSKLFYMNFLVDKCHCNFFTTSSLCNIEVLRCQDTPVFPKGQQCKQIICVGLRHWKPWLSWLWVTQECQSRSLALMVAGLGLAGCIPCQLSASWISAHPVISYLIYVRSYHGHYTVAQGNAEWRKDGPRATENLIFQPALEIMWSRFYGCC